MVNKVFPLAPDTDRNRGATDFVTASKALKELAAAFGTDTPTLRASRGKGASYVPARKSIRWGRRSYRGIDALLHEFAHHLQKEPRFAAMKPRGRVTTTWYGRTKEARSIHGPDFFAALLEVATFAYGDHKHFTWANEYRSIAAKYKRQYGESFDVHKKTADPRHILDVLGVRVSMPRPMPLPIAAAPRRQPKAPASAARRAQGKAAWAPPSEVNNWEGGCLWRKFKGPK
jgi:hypothetical protein